MISILIQLIPITIFVNVIAAIPAAIWINGKTESILIPVIVTSFFLRTLVSSVVGGVDIVQTLVIVLLGLLTTAGVNAIVTRVRKQSGTN